MQPTKGKPKMNTNSKKNWAQPNLTSYGTIAELTAKDWGFDDGFSATITAPNGNVVGTIAIGSGNCTVVSTGANSSPDPGCR